MKKYDAIIIGFGKGGKTLAAEFAKRQKTVAIVERSDRMYGGTCINIGCIPTKTLVHLAKETPVKATWEEKKDYYRQAIGRKDEVTSFLRNKNYHNLADNPNVTVYTGVGSFAGPDVVEVRTETEVIELQSSQIFINTGAETIVPPIDGIKENPCVYTSTSIMELEALPERLVIVGGGYIGLEFASMYASFGSKVTVLEGYPELIGREDRDIAASVQTVLEKKGIVFHLNAKVQSVDGATVIYEDAVTHEIHHLEGDAILLATGRRPNTSGLNLEVAGVKVNERGVITPLTGNEMNFYDLLLPENPGTVVMDGKEYIWNTWGEILNPPADAQVWATYKNEFYEGSPAVTFRKLGKGTITYVGVDSHNGALEKDILKKLYVQLNIPVMDLPYGVTMEYRNGLGIVLNYSDQPYTFNLSKGAKALIGTTEIPTAGVFVFSVK